MIGIVNHHWSIFRVFPFFLSAQEIHGNPAVQSVVCGNSTAEILATPLMPLAEWLYLPWMCEQPALAPVLNSKLQ